MMLRMVIMAPIMFLGGLIMAISKDATLSLVIIAVIPILIIVILLILKKGMPLFKSVQKRLDKLNLVMRENLMGIRVIRAFNSGSEEQERLAQANMSLTYDTIRINKLMAFID